MSYLKTVDKIIYSSTKFYEELKNDENGRYRSWEQCYTAFCEARNKKDIDYDYLSLMLAFYLASWGMYRGSSFLLQRDYKVHIPVVKEIMKSKYDCLVGINCSELKDPKVLKVVCVDLPGLIKKHYRPHRLKVVEKRIEKDISDTLITKILMGTLACVPAYDRYFIDGIKKESISTGNFNDKSMIKLIEFYEDNKKELDKVRKSMKVGKREYPQMKMLDMGFWQIGFDLDKSKGIKKSH